jgi:hypothetical protein
LFNNNDLKKYFLTIFFTKGVIFKNEESKKAANKFSHLLEKTVVQFILLKHGPPPLTNLFVSLQKGKPFFLYILKYC